MSHATILYPNKYKKDIADSFMQLVSWIKLHTPIFTTPLTTEK
jgi:hypothetical protein